MTEKELLDFKKKIANYDLNQLKKYKDELEAKMTRMILDSDLIEYIALVTAMMEQKENGQA